jgi:PadR family transcriptional regulator PadR
LHSQMSRARLSSDNWDSQMSKRTAGKVDVWQGTLALMVLKTLETMGPLHGFGLARRIEQISGHRLALNPGTLYPTLLKLEQEGFIASAWGTSENNRRARFYRLTRAGRKQVDRETREWENATDIVAQFLAPKVTP